MSTNRGTAAATMTIEKRKQLTEWSGYRPKKNNLVLRGMSLNMPRRRMRKRDIKASEISLFPMEKMHPCKNTNDMIASRTIMTMEAS